MIEAFARDDVDDSPMPGEAWVTWLGHGAVVIRSSTTRIIVDPILRDRIVHLRSRASMAEYDIARVDAVLVSHAHHDHLDVESLRRIQPQAPKLAPQGADRVMRSHRIRSVETVRVGDRRTVGDISIETVHAHHGGGRLIARRGDEAVGYVLRMPGSHSVFVAGDTALHDGMAGIGPVDVAVLPVGGWWRRPVNSEHLDPVQAIEAAARVGARVVIPVHWGTLHPVFLRRFMDPVWDATLETLDHLAGSVGSIDVRILDPGETIRFGVPLRDDARSGA